jgi:hypothetical protein
MAAERGILYRKILTKHYGEIIHLQHGEPEAYFNNLAPVRSDTEDPFVWTAKGFHQTVFLR